MADTKGVIRKAEENNKRGPGNTQLTKKQTPKTERDNSQTFRGRRRCCRVKTQPKHHKKE
jgi:hypothetical protein